MKRFAMILAALGSVSSPTACALTAGGLILSLSGNTGNAAILNMRQTFGADFTPAAEGGVPEPSTWALLGGGLAAIGMLRRR